MLDAIKYHFRHLADFSGRDGRQTFWFWFLFLFILNIAASMLFTMPMMAEGMAAGMQAARGGDPEAVQGMVMVRMAGRMESMMWVSLGLGIFNLLMMGAALTRRAHDSGRSGLWAGAVGAIYLASIAFAWSRIDDVSAMMMAAAENPASALELQSRMGVDGLVGWLPLILVAILGLLKSDPGPNKYGAEPVRF